jgi:hypothetical protein
MVLPSNFVIRYGVVINYGLVGELVLVVGLVTISQGSLFSSRVRLLLVTVNT